MFYCILDIFLWVWFSAQRTSNSEGALWWSLQSWECVSYPRCMYGQSTSNKFCRWLEIHDMVIVFRDSIPILLVSPGDLVTHMQYVVFEYCSGSDLFNFLVTGPFERMSRFDVICEFTYIVYMYVPFCWYHMRINSFNFKLLPMMAKWKTFSLLFMQITVYDL